MKQLLLSILLILLLWKCLILTGCAVIVPPSGGPRDSLPPVLVSAIPKNYSLQFKTNRIVFTFDEYLDVKDIHTNLLVSPFPKSEPIVDAKLKTITVRLKDSLQPNTTYSFNFGKAIRDINEGNILKNFSYVFSTGSYIDSLQFAGRVLLAATGKPDSTLIVMLHTESDDSSVIKNRPRYTTRLDSSGNFNFRYLAPGTYYLYALKDESGTAKYTSPSQIFAFASAPVVIGEANSPVTMYAYADTSGNIKKKVAATIKAPVKSKNQDKEKRMILQPNTNNGQLDLLGDLEIKFPTPLKSFDSSQISFTDGVFKPITTTHFILDSTHTKITLKFRWLPETKFHVIAQKDFAEDTLGKKLAKIDTISFQTKRESDYGSLLLRFKNLDLHRKPVLLFLQKDAIKKTFIFTNSPRFYEKLFAPGDYDLRILYDDNQNGVWDPGQFVGKHRQPEIVQDIRTNTNRPFTVKPDWDNEVDIVL